MSMCGQAVRIFTLPNSLEDEGSVGGLHIRCESDTEAMQHRVVKRVVILERSRRRERLIRKRRNGPIGDRRLKFVDRYARFEDLESGIV